MKKLLTFAAFLSISVSIAFAQVLVSQYEKEEEIDNVIHYDVPYIRVYKVLSDTEIIHKEYKRSDLFNNSQRELYIKTSGNVLSFAEESYEEPFAYFSVDEKLNLTPVSEENFVEKELPKVYIRGERIAMAEYAPNKVACLSGRTGKNIERYDISNPDEPEEIKAVWNLFKTALKTKDTSNLSKIFNYQLSPLDYEDYNWRETVLYQICQTKSPDFILACFKAIDKVYGIPVYMPGCVCENPIYNIIAYNDVKTLKKVIEWKPLLATAISGNGQFSSESPIVWAVSIDSVEIVKLLLPHIKDINRVSCIGDKGSEANGYYYNNSNLLSFAKSDEMRKLLIGAGIQTFIPLEDDASRDTYIDDYNVNIRDGASINAKKIDRLTYKDKIKVIGIDPYFYNIDNYYGHWLKIQYGENKEGFIFEKYIFQFRQ